MIDNDGVLPLVLLCLLRTGLLLCKSCFSTRLPANSGCEPVLLFAERSAMSSRTAARWRDLTCGLRHPMVWWRRQCASASGALGLIYFPADPFASSGPSAQTTRVRDDTVVRSSANHTPEILIEVP